VDPVSVVVWARHGESDANVSRTFSHRIYDPDLTELGRRQARELAERLALRPETPAAIVCSPMRRARQTADRVAQELGISGVTELENLRELDVGSLDGRRDAAGWQLYQDVLAAWVRGDLDARLPDGENGHELVARVRRGLVDAAGLGAGATVLAVAHGGNLRAALPWMTGGSDPEGDLPNVGVATFDVDGGGRIRLLEWPQVLP
jgi:probable phosphoglycerate mutase